MNKMKSLLKLSVFVGLFVVSSGVVNAQRFDAKKKYWSIGGNINAINYVGDITSARSRLSVPFKFTRQNIGFCAVRRMTPRMSGRANLFYGRLKSNDREFGNEPLNGQYFGRWHRGAAFVNNIYELSGTVIVDFYENRGTWQKRPDYTPYVFAGLGVIYQNPKALIFKKGDDGTQVIDRKVYYSDVKLPNGVSMAGSKIQGALLYGAGFRYKLDKRWDLALEIGWRITTTDKLDGVFYEVWQDSDAMSPQDAMIYDKTGVIYEDGTGFVRNTKIQNTSNRTWGTTLSDPSTGEYRGDPPNDGYIVTGFHLTRIIGGGVKCPKFR